MNIEELSNDLTKKRDIYESLGMVNTHGKTEVERILLSQAYNDALNNYMQAKVALEDALRPQFMVCSREQMIIMRKKCKLDTWFM